MKILTIVIVVLTFSSFASLAQISKGGFPKSYKKEVYNLFDNDTTISTQKGINGKKHMIKIDLEAKREREKAEKTKSDCKTCTLPYYGYEIPLEINFFDNAELQKIEDGGELWILKFDTKDWHGFQFLFNDFYLPEESELFFYNEDKSMELGAFTSTNNREDNQFVTQPLIGDQVCIEYYQPAGVNERAILQIGAVVCVFNDSFLRKGPFSQDGAPPCMINTSCPDAYGWENEVKAVGMILEKDASNNYWGVCSGTLINKSTPYVGSDNPLFLSANHCYESYNRTNGSSTYSNVNNWVFLFRHEGEFCSSDGSTTPKSLTKSVTGATVLAADLHSRTSDYLLLRLNCTVDQIADYDVSFAGWSKEESDGYSEQTFAIHHPKGDLKKFTYSYSPVTSANNTADINNTDPRRINSMWKVSWNGGVTAQGSSGCGMFNDRHQLVGHLYYGGSSCSEWWVSDYFGKFSKSFNYGNFQNYLGNSYSVSPYTPARGELNLSITSNPQQISPGTNASFTAVSNNKFGNLHCWWIVNTEQGDLDVTCNSTTDANCNASNINPTPTYYFGSAGNYKVSLWAVDDAGKQGFKEFVVNVSDAVNNCVTVNIWGKGDCENTRIFPLGATLQLTDYAFAEYCRIYPGGPLLYDGIKTIKWYYDGALKSSYNFNKTANCFVDDNCYNAGYSLGCFTLDTSGKHIIKMEAYAGQLNSGSFIQVSPPSSISKEIYVVNCNAIKSITTQVGLNAVNGYIGDGIVVLEPSAGSSIIVNQGGKLTVDTYNKAILKAGVKFSEGASCLIKAMPCPSPDCGCNSLKRARAIDVLTEVLDKNPLGKEVCVFPNPALDYTIVDLGSMFQDVISIELVDVSGRALYNQNCSIQLQNHINTGYLTPGVYFVKINTNNGQVTKKILKR